jgi:hypothetical protein
MQDEIKSEGKCLYCGETFAQAQINRHVATHLKEKTKTGKPGKSFLVKIETPKKWGRTPYFLSLWIDGEAKMEAIDDFLRDIWLECCGHMSAFSTPRKRFSGTKTFDIQAMFNSFMEDNESEFPREIPKNRKAKDVLYKELSLEYEYDFGSTTELKITTVAEYPIKADKKIVLLSRNERVEIICSMCKKVPATQICTECMYHINAKFCNKCASKHAKKCAVFDDYASMPIVNSPRMGVCGYTGGVIDTERD